MTLFFWDRFLGRKSGSNRTGKRNRKPARRTRVLGGPERLEDRALFAVVTLSPTADTYVRAGNYANTNYGSASTVNVRNHSTVSNDMEGFFRFDLNSVSGTIQNVTLKLTPQSVGADLRTESVRVRLLTDAVDAWVEGNGGTNNNPINEMTWNNHPTGAGSEVLVAGTLPAVNQRLSINVTPLVTQASNANKVASFQLDIPTAATHRLVNFYSRSHSTTAYRPTLEVTTASAPPSVSINDVSVVEGNPTAGASYLHTSGSQIVDAAGNNVKLAGVSWFGLESSTFSPHGLWARNWQSMMQQMQQQGFNTIRLPFSNQLFNAGSVPNGIDFGLNPDLVGQTGLQIMDKIVQYAGTLGLRILLDHHRSDAGAGPNGNGLWHTTAYPESRWISDWTMLATRYANNPTVIGADLHNEPHGAATWGDGSANDWRLAAERGGNAVLAANPNWLIVVEGIENYAGQNYWWGGNLAGAAAHPVRLDVPGRLVYSPHDYPASVYPQTWFSDPNYPANLPAIWDAKWGYLFRNNIAPVLLGEFGSRLATTSDQQWATTIVKYLGGDFNLDNVSDLSPGQQGISWTWWSWNPNSGDTGGILADDWSTVLTSKTTLLDPIEFVLPASSVTTTPATFTVTLSSALASPVTVAYTTSPGTATSSDFTAASGTLTFAPGETSKSLTVLVTRETIAEPNETFTVTLSSPTNATLADSTGLATIVDDDTSTPPSISVTDATVTEGHTGTTNAVFTVTLSATSLSPVTVAYSTRTDTALSPTDYTVVSGTLTFASGETSKTISVPILGDTTIESTEQFFLDLSSATNATLLDALGLGLIVTDDFPPTSANVTWSTASVWDTGFTANVSIQNTSAQPWTDWIIEFDHPFNITNIWSAVILSHVGTRYRIRAESWNRTVAPGATVSFGYQADPGNPTAPTNIVVIPTT